MTVEQNIRLVRRLFEEQASRDDTSLYEEIFSGKVVLYGPASGQAVKGLKSLIKVDKGYHKAYPGARFEIEEIAGFGDQVMVRWSCRATYKKGPILLKKKEFCIWGLSVYRLRKGKIEEIRQFWDRLGILEQIGEVQVRTDPVEPGYYAELLKNLGMEKYLEKSTLLSPREKECLELLLQGKTAKEMASILHLSPRTVESYFVNLKKKLKCAHKGQLFSTARVLKDLELL